MYRDFYIKTFLRKDSPDSEWSYYVSLVLDQKEIDTYPLHLDSWSLEEFKKQWIEGLNQLKIHNKSCIINSYYNSNPLSKEPDIVGVHMWAFFKKGNELRIEQQILGDETSRRKFKETLFTAENCYEFIRPQQEKLTNEFGREYAIWFCEYNSEKIDKIIEHLQNDPVDQTHVKEKSDHCYKKG